MPDIPKGSKPNRNYTHQSSVVSWYNQQHAAEADRAAFPKDDAWAAVCTLVDFPPCQSRKNRRSGKPICDCCGNFFQLVERKKIRTCCENRADFIVFAVFAKSPYGIVVVVVSV